MHVVCGIDEAGRGPLAGPVTAGAVVLPESCSIALNDSKKLSARQRLHAFHEITETATAWSVGWAWPEEIDQHNIHCATLIAMKRAFYGIHADVDEVLVDGLYVPSLPCAARAVVRGDSYIRQIQAASILAKTCRDAWMVRYSWIEPGYGYDMHKGYPTKKHREACISLGPSPIQRKSFRISV